MSYLTNPYRFGVPAPTPFSDDSDLKFYGKFSESSGDIINQSESSDSLGDSADIEITGATYNQSSFADWSSSMYFDGVDDYGQFVIIVQQIPLPPL